MSRHAPILAALAAAALAAHAQAQFAIPWYTIDGGGGTSSGGAFVLSGTMGQPDASSPATPMTGGSFSLVGGFWAGVGTAAACPCEFDGDAAQVNVFDLLAYLALWFPMDPGADIDGTPGVDVFDLLEFLSCWFPASAGQPCP